MIKVSEVEGILKQEDKKLKSSQDYNELRIFLKQAQESGLVLKKEYSIAQTDTIGKRYTPQVSNKVKTS